MDEIVDYLLAMEAGHGIDPAGSPATVAATVPPPSLPSKAALPPTRADGLAGLLLERLGDEAVRRAIARLIAPR